MRSHPEEWLAPYVRGELAASERAAVDVHLEGCAECRRAVADTRTVLAALAAAPPAAPPVAWDAYVAELRARRDLRRRIWPRRAAIAAPAAAAVALALIALQPMPDPTLEAERAQDAVLAQRLDLLRQYPVVERLDLLEDFDAIQSLDVLPVRDG